MITGKPGCGQDELARIIHRISKRRDQPFVSLSEVPEDRRNQTTILKQKATKGTLALDLGMSRKRLDLAFVSSMFSPGYNIRVIVLARTSSQARRALGHQYWRPLMHVALCPMALRRAAIHRLLDEQLAARDSKLRVADLTLQNQRALLFNPWRENLQSLREAAERLDAIVTSEFSRRKAAEALGIVRQTFYHWFNNTMRLSKPLVTDARRRALIAALSARPPALPAAEQRDRRL